MSAAGSAKAEGCLGSHALKAKLDFCPLSFLISLTPTLIFLLLCCSSHFHPVMQPTYISHATTPACCVYISIVRLFRIALTLRRSFLSYLHPLAQPHLSALQLAAPCITASISSLTSSSVLRKPCPARSPPVHLFCPLLFLVYSLLTTL